MTTIKRGIIYQLDKHGKPITYKRWTGDIVAGLYDHLMQSNVFPKKFNVDYHRHIVILQNLCANLHHLDVLEIATGTGNVVEFLPADNNYTGTDISPNMLKIAIKKLTQAGFKEPQFHICDVANLPFAEAQFDVVMCHLSLNFFPSAPAALVEIQRVLKPGGKLLLSIPLPEKKLKGVAIRGTLYTQQQLQQLCNQAGVQLTMMNESNGCLGYFWGEKA